jgi:hypothetical protein
MNRKITAGSRCPWRRRPPLFQDLAFFDEDPVLAPQPAQLLALVRTQAGGAALVDVDLARPATQRLRRDAQLASEFGHRLAAALEQLDRLAAELQRIRRRHEH